MLTIQEYVNKLSNMANPYPKTENLINNADLTPKQRQESASRAGKASVKAKRKAKEISQIYGHFLSKKYKTKSGEDVYGDEMAESVIVGVLSRKDSSAVSMLKEMREAREGSKSTVTIQGIGNVRFQNDDNTDTKKAE